MDKMRAEFECEVINRMKESGFLEVEVRAEMLITTSSGYYYDATVSGWWDFWRSSRAALCVELPPAKDDAYQYNQALHDVAGVLQSSGLSYK